MTEQELQDSYNKRLEKIETDLADIKTLLTKLEGAGTLVKLCFFIGAPAVGAIVWLKDHVKF